MKHVKYFIVGTLLGLGATILGVGLVMGIVLALTHLVTEQVVLVGLFIIVGLMMSWMCYQLGKDYFEKAA